MVLLSSFGPFLQHQFNPTKVLAEKLISNGLNAKHIHLPVSFAESFLTFQNFYQSIPEPSLILMLGFAPQRKVISLEKVAINLIHSKLSDNQGFKYSEKLILPDAASLAYFSPFNLQNIINDIDSDHIELSFNAGTFVCNFLYFNVLVEMQKNRIPALFVHVPHLMELEGNSGLGLKIDLQVELLEKIIVGLRKQIEMSAC